MEGCIGTLLRGGRGVVPKNHRGLLQSVVVYVNASIIIIIEILDLELFDSTFLSHS